MEENKIIFHLLLPSHEKPARTIDPGMAAFDYPSTRTIARDHFFLAFFFPSTANVGLVMPSEQIPINWRGVVCGIQAQMLRLLRCGLWSADQETIKSGAEL